MATKKTNDMLAVQLLVQMAVLLKVVQKVGYTNGY